MSEIQKKALQAIFDAFFHSDAGHEFGIKMLSSRAMPKPEDFAWIVKALTAQGLAIVPIEPTEEMCDAGRQSLRNNGLMPAFTDKGSAGQEPILKHLLRPAYKAMLKANGPD